MKPSDKFVHSNCRTVSDVLSRIGDKWTVMVVGLLGSGPKRFNEIRKTIDGISQRMLTLTLRGLERDGLVTRTVYPNVPPRVDYALTDLGHSLLEPIISLGDWALTNQPRIAEARRAYDATIAAEKQEEVVSAAGRS